MPNILIKDLSAELVTRCTELPEFRDRGFSIFDMDDLVQKSKFQGFPVVGVSYEGATVKGTGVSNTGSANTRCAPDVMVLTFRFSVTIGMEYAAVGKDDSKEMATDLLDALRRSMLGYMGINSRPWVLAGEAPQDGDIEGVIFYGQIWETDILTTSS